MARISKRNAKKSLQKKTISKPTAKSVIRKVASNVKLGEHYKGKYTYHSDNLPEDYKKEIEFDGLKWYQKMVIDTMVDHPHLAILLDPGLGKTLCTLEAFNILRKQKKVSKLFVLAPLRVVYSVWPEEIRKFKFGFNIAILHDKKKDDSLESNADVYVMNYEGLKWLKTRMQKLFTLAPQSMLMLDESSKVKKTNTQRFKLLKPMLALFIRRYCGTGSPAPNGLIDLFGQIFCIDLGKTLGQYITHYRNRYFYSTGYGGYTWELQPGKDKEIYRALEPISVRFSNDVLDLPPIVPKKIILELDERSRQLYNEVERELIAQWEKGEIVAVNAAAASMKLRQITAGAVYGQCADEVAIQHVHNIKTEALKDLIDELEGKQALIAYEFKPELKALQKEFKKAPYIGGGVSAKQGAHLVNQWNAGKLPILFGNAQSMAYGLNMQKVRAAVIWHSLTWNLEHYEQFWQRIRRQGQKYPVMMYHFIMKDTVDEEIYFALQSKDRTQRALLDALGARFQKVA